MNILAKALLLTPKKKEEEKEQHITSHQFTGCKDTSKAEPDYTVFTMYKAEGTASVYLRLYFDVQDFYTVVQTSGNNTTEYNTAARSAIAFPSAWNFSYPLTMTYDIQEKESGKVVQSFSVIYYTLEAQGGV